MAPKKRAPRQERAIAEFSRPQDADAAWRALLPTVRCCGVDTRLGLVCLLPGPDGGLRLLRARLEAAAGALLGPDEGARVRRSWHCAFGDAAEVALSPAQLDALLEPGPVVAPRTPAEAAVAAARARLLLREPGWAQTAAADGDLDVLALRRALRLPAAPRHVALGFLDVPQLLRPAALIEAHAALTRELGIRVEDVEAASRGRVLYPHKPCCRRRSSEIAA